MKMCMHSIIFAIPWEFGLSKIRENTSKSKKKVRIEFQVFNWVLDLRYTMFKIRPVIFIISPLADLPSSTHRVELGNRRAKSSGGFLPRIPGQLLKSLSAFIVFQKANLATVTGLVCPCNSY